MVDALYQPESGRGASPTIGFFPTQFVLGRFKEVVTMTMPKEYVEQQTDLYLRVGRTDVRDMKDDPDTQYKMWMQGQYAVPVLSDRIICHGSIPDKPEWVESVTYTGNKVYGTVQITWTNHKCTVMSRPGSGAYRPAKKDFMVFPKPPARVAVERGMTIEALYAEARVKQCRQNENGEKE